MGHSHPLLLYFVFWIELVLGRYFSPIVRFDLTIWTRKSRVFLDQIWLLITITFTFLGVHPKDQPDVPGLVDGLPPADELALLPASTNEAVHRLQHRVQGRSQRGERASDRHLRLRHRPGPRGKDPGRACQRTRWGGSVGFNAFTATENGQLSL